ncbi:MAG: DUF115 domain-containing protein [Treponema sp.]|nr:DUF115 domain-containing protein [Treponema sp.]
MNENTSEKPCLVQAGRGFSVSYKGRFLYSKYAPERAICGAIESLTLLPGTLIIAASPLLWLGLNSLLKKLPENCFVLGVETDENLYELAKNALDSSVSAQDDRIALLPFRENDYIVNILCGERAVASLNLPHISTFRRSIILEMSAGTQFSKEKYAEIASLAQNSIATFWKNRITLTRLGRLYSRNLFKNLPALIHSIDFRTLAHTIEKPIFVFGAGESIEGTISELREENLKNYFVLAVDAAIPSLKAHGITADALVAVEGQLAIEKAYIGGGAKESLLICDILSRPSVIRHTKTAVSFFASNYTHSQFLRNLSQKDFFPPTIPPLGSVGLTATYIALLLRKNSDIPVFVTGLDFSFSLGRTHTKNAPAHISRLCSTNRLSPVENYAAAFKNGAKRIIGKNGTEVFTDTGLDGYAKSFVDAFSATQNLYDIGKQGLPLGIHYLEKPDSLPQQFYGQNEVKIPPNKSLSGHNQEKLQEIKAYLEGEESALNRIKELLMFGQDVASCSMSLEEELYSLIAMREYLFLHFPDGYKCAVQDLSFLKRVRGQIDFFLKDIKKGLSKLQTVRQPNKILD